MANLDIELLSLLNLFQPQVPPGIYQDYYNAFSRINNSWYFPGNLLFAISDTLHNKRVVMQLDEPGSWKDLFDDICQRFKNVESQLKLNNGISQRLKSALDHTNEYCQSVYKALADGRQELFQFLAKWGINCLENLNNIINDNLLILGGGPVGLVTAYFLQKSIPNFKTVLVEKRPKYTRTYQLFLAEDTFDTLPYEIQKGLWGYGRYGCYILPPPIDAKGYCFINPPIDTQVPDHYYSAIYDNEFFDIDSLTGRRTFKRLMSIPIGVFENAMEELLRIKYPQIKIIKPRTDTEYNIVENNDTSARGLNSYVVKDETGTIVEKNLFRNNDAMYNYIIDTTGAQSLEQVREKEGSSSSPQSETALTLIVKSDFSHIKHAMTSKNVDLRPAQNNSRFFSNNEKWHTALLSIRNLPDNANFYNKSAGKIEWTDISEDNQKYIKNEYTKYTNKDLNPADITQINLILIELTNRSEHFETLSNDTFKFYVGDSACAVHFFSGTGINNGIRMATKLTEMLTKVYRSRWKSDPTIDFAKWNSEMRDMCDETLTKSEKIMGSVRTIHS